MLKDKNTKLSEIINIGTQCIILELTPSVILSSANVIQLQCVNSVADQDTQKEAVVPFLRELKMRFLLECYGWTSYPGEC